MTMRELSLIVISSGVVPRKPRVCLEAGAEASAATTRRRPTLNEEYLARAKVHVSDVRVFINGVAKRAAELAHGARPLVPTLPQDERTHLDIALLEVAEGKIKISVDD